MSSHILWLKYQGTGSMHRVAGGGEGGDRGAEGLVGSRR